jgi:hypothetical protein
MVTPSEVSPMFVEGEVEALEAVSALATPKSVTTATP